MPSIDVVNGPSDLKMKYPSGTSNSLPGRVGGILSPPFRTKTLLVTTAHAAAFDPDLTTGRWLNLCECSAISGCTATAKVPRGTVNGANVDFLNWADNNWFLPAFSSPTTPYIPYDIAFVLQAGVSLSTVSVNLAATAIVPGEGASLAIIGPHRDAVGPCSYPTAHVPIMLTHGIHRHVLYHSGMVFSMTVPASQLPASAADRRALEGSLVVENHGPLNGNNRVGLSNATVIGILIAVEDIENNNCVCHCHSMHADWPAMC